MTASVSVQAPRQSNSQGWPMLSSTITVDGRPFEIFYRVSQGALSPAANAFLAAALLPAMRTAAPLRVDGAISPRLGRNLRQFQSIFHTWFREFAEIELEATAWSARPAIGSDVAAFFSCGVDSFYTVLKHLDEISHLVFVHGFDLRLDETQLRAEVAAAIRQAAADLGKPLIEVETNLRSLLDVYCHWDEHADGTALASVALALSRFKTIYIASSQPYHELVPVSSHPLLNPLWSTESMEVVHDGCEATRWEKLERIVDNPVVRRWLRVCFRNYDGAYNCGRCGKCLRVRTFLRFRGLQGTVATFPATFDLDLLGEAIHAAPHHYRPYMELLEYMESHEGDAETLRFMRAALGEPSQVHEQRAEDKIHNLQRRVQSLEAQLSTMSSSTSWQVTAPLRAAGRLAGRLRNVRSGGSKG